MNTPVIQEHAGVVVVRDDLLEGGTKVRAIPALFEAGTTEYVYASPVYGYAQIALAIAARAHGKKAVIFCAKRKAKHARTLKAESFGAIVHEVPCGYLSVVKARAREYAEWNGCLLPFGLDDDRMIEGIANAARSISMLKPTEVWSVAGSGVLTRSLQKAWPSASFHAVRIGAEGNIGNAALHVAPEKFEQDAQQPPPFPSCGNYDAKAWRFVKQHARPGALFWNVAA